VCKTKKPNVYIEGGIKKNLGEMVTVIRPALNDGEVEWGGRETTKGPGCKLVFSQLGGE